MRKQDFIIHLIQSLSPNESRYFKLYSDVLPGQKEYMKLFDALENKTEYDVEALCKELNLTTSQLAERKHYLSQVLLKSIRYFKDGDTLDSHLANCMFEAQELADRNLHSYALEILDKALIKAHQEEAIHQLPVLISKKLNVLHMMGRYDEVLLLEDELIRARGLSDELMEIAIFNAHVVKFEQSRKEPKEFPLASHRLLHVKPGDIQSSRGQMAWFTTMHAYYVAVNDMPQLLEHVRMEVAFYEANPKAREFAPYQFLVSQIRLVTTEGFARNFEGALLANERLLNLLADSSKKIPAHTLNDMTLFAGYCKAGLLFSLGQYHESVAQSEKVYAHRQQMVDYVQYTLVFDYAKALMHVGRAADAVQKLDELLQINTELRSDLQPYIRPLLMLAQLDCGNYQLVPYLVKSARSWMKRRKIVEPEANLLISLCYSIANAPDTQRRKHWLKLKEAVDAGMLNAADNELHLQDWLNRKISK